MDALIGALIDGRYRVVAAAASGSMGAVYKAERVPVGKTVAIKFLHASFATDDEFLIRFERETRVMSKLAHPHCVSVVDFGVWEEAPYLVMEYVDGVTLRRLLDDGPLVATRALRFARQLAAGLAHAHAHGVVHRDIKPANVMITDETGLGEHARILDFGLARLREPGGAGRDPTQANVVVGTPNYMAPEQTIAGGLLDARTDIYAAGVVLFEMITGDRPFAADETLELLQMHRKAPIPRLAERVERGTVVPEGMQDLIDTAMAKAPEDRYANALELLSAIDAVAERARLRRTGPRRAVADVPVETAPTLVHVETAQVRRVSNVNRYLVAALVTVVLGAGAVVLWLLRGREAAVAPPTPDAMVVAVVIPDAPLPPPDAAIIDDAPAPDAYELEEIQMEPETAVNPSPDHDRPAAEEQAADEPETTEDIEKRAPPPPVLATSVPAAVQLIKEGKHELAIASLNALYRKAPKNPYLPFLLGNAYFDQRWWSVAMDHYRAAITLEPRYKNNAVLNRNIIRMLASKKTSGKAEAFLRRTIGKPSLPYLKRASTDEASVIVRRQAAAVAKTIR